MCRRELWHRFIDEARFKAFIEIVLEQESRPRLGVANLVMCTGIGGFKPNTLVLLFPDKPQNSRYPVLTGTPGHAQSFPRQQISAPLVDLMTNSVYDSSVENGCRVTCAFQRDLWQDSDTNLAAARWSGSEAEGERDAVLR
eukprot:COSAG01_NODE_8887_length_2626_cov_2.205382_5_plen_141_part_00